eukprot:1411413-Rhodomonas_salina.3
MPRRPRGGTCDRAFGSQRRAGQVGLNRKLATGSAVLRMTLQVQGPEKCERKKKTALCSGRHVAFAHDIGCRSTLVVELPR